jgi:hypothetical protein
MPRQRKKSDFPIAKPVWFVNFFPSLGVKKKWEVLG